MLCSMTSSTKHPFPQPERLTIAGGVPLYVLRSDGHEAVRIDIVVSAGQWEQDRMLQSLFTNRMLREGTLDHTASQFAEQLDRYGAWLELSVSGHHSFITLYTLRRYARETCSLLAEMLFHPIFPDDRLSTVKANNKSQYLVSSCRGDVMARRMLYRSLYGPDHPCARFAIEGHFDAICRDDIVRYYQTFYRPEGLTIYLSGHIDDAIVSSIDATFTSAIQAQSNAAGSLPVCSTFDGVSDYINLSTGRPSVTSPLPDISIAPKERVLIHHQPGAVQTSLCMGGLMMDVNSDDYCAMRVVSALLGGYFGSRLMRSIREEKGLTYSISTDLLTNTHQVLFTVVSECQADKGEAVAHEVRSECERLCSDLVPEEELTLVRNYMEGEMLRNYEGVFALADAAIYMHTLCLHPDHLERSLHTVRSIDVHTVRDTARRWLHADNLVVALVMP